MATTSYKSIAASTILAAAIASGVLTLGNSRVSDTGAGLTVSSTLDGGVASLTIGETTITAALAAKIARGEACEAWPEDCGAIAGDLIDDSAAIQCAANAVASCGGIVRFTAGAYIAETAIVVPDRVGLSGKGRLFDRRVSQPSPATNFGTVLLSSKLDNFSLVRLGNGSFIEDMVIDVYAVNTGMDGGSANALVPTAGIAISFTGKYGVRISRVVVNRAWVGIGSVNAAPDPESFKIEHFQVWNAKSVGVLLDNVIYGSVSFGFIMNPVYNSAFFQQGIGIHFKNGVETITVTDNTLVEDFLDCFRIDGGTTALSMAHNIQFSNSTADTCARNGLAVVNAAGVVWQGGYIGGGGYGFYVDENGGSTTDVDVSGTRFFSNAWHGAALIAGTNIRVHHNKFMLGGTSNVYDAIRVWPGMSYFTITGNHASLTDPRGGGSGSFGYVVRTGSGSDHYEISGNLGTGTLGTVLDGSAGAAHGYSRNP